MCGARFSSIQLEGLDEAESHALLEAWGVPAEQRAELLAQLAAVAAEYESLGDAVDPPAHDEPVFTDPVCQFRGVYRGFADKDQVVAYLYLGTPASGLKSLPDDSPADFIRELP